MTNFFKHIEKFDLAKDAILAKSKNNFQSRMTGLLSQLFKQFPNLVEARWYVDIRYNDHGYAAFPLVTFAYSYPENDRIAIDNSPWLSLHGRDIEGLECRPQDIMDLVNVSVLHKIDYDDTVKYNYEYYKTEHAEEFAKDPKAFEEKYLTSDIKPGLWQDELMRYCNNHGTEEDELYSFERTLSVKEFLLEHPSLEQSNALAIMANLSTIVRIVISKEYDIPDMGFYSEGGGAYEILMNSALKNGRATREGVFFEDPHCPLHLL